MLFSIFKLFDLLRYFNKIFILIFFSNIRMGVNIALEISKTRRGKKKEKKNKDSVWFCEINEWLTFLWKIKNLPATNWCLVQFYYHIESHYFCYIWCHLSIFNPKKCHKFPRVSSWSLECQYSRSTYHMIWPVPERATCPFDRASTIYFRTL